MTSGINVLREALRERKEEKEAKVAHKKTQPKIREPASGKEKLCSKCKKYYPADLEWFYKDARSKTGLSSRCRQCQQVISKKSNKPSKQKSGNGKMNLVLDFSEVGLLLADISAQAVTDFRTPEMQAMWLISQALNQREVNNEQL